MKFGTDFMDTELTFLQELCELLDGKLSILEGQIKSVSDPESHGYFDQAEYFIGVGFCAMQRYTLDVLKVETLTGDWPTPLARNIIQAKVSFHSLAALQIGGSIRPSGSTMYLMGSSQKLGIKHDKL